MSFLLALGFSIILTPAARRAGRALRLVDRPGALKIHVEPVSVLGGAAVIASTLGAFAITHHGLAAGLGVGIPLALATGIIDDARHLPPGIRVALLCVAGLALGLELVGLEVGTLGIVALVLACSNAVNLIDGQDGLAGGLAAIAAVTLAALLAQSGRLDAGLGFALGGSLLAFLLWNRPPARIFLGNGGAYGVGTCLAALAAETVLRAGWRGLLAAGVCLSVLAWELLFTVARRLRSGKPLTGGDRAHSYDLAAESLGSRARSTVLFWGLGALAGAMALAVRVLPLAAGAAITSMTAGISAVSVVLLWSRAVQSVHPRTERSSVADEGIEAGT